MPSRAEHRRATREALLDAALEEFGRRGYGPVSHADIAYAAGMARTTFYEYFASKEDLLIALVEERIPVVFDEMIGSIPDDLDPEERLAELVNRLIQFLAQEPVLGIMLHREIPRFSIEAQQRIAASHRTLARELVAVIADGLNAGRLESGLSAAVLARIVYDMIMAAGRILNDSEDPKQQVHDVASATVDLILHGIGT